MTIEQDCPTRKDPPASPCVTLQLVEQRLNELAEYTHNRVHEINNNLMTLAANRTLDHDLLVGLNGKMDKLMGESNSTNLIQSDHEKRIRSLERVMFLGMGGLAVLQVVLHILGGKA